ncbi:MAG: S8 family serine peptidase [Bacillota bacterium]|nr:S8 family serine peptidase [Bacillota bacterium]
MIGVDDSLRPHLHKCDPALLRHLQGVTDPQAELRLLVQGRPGLDEAAAGELRRHVEGCGARVVGELPLVDALVVTLPRRSLGALAAHPAVLRLHLDRTVHALLDVAVPTVDAPAAWSSGWTGKGVTIAILDTGVYPHADLTRPENRIVAFHDLVNGRSEPYDDNGHGTHVAGCALGNGHSSQGRYKGSAPEARLAAVKVLDAQGSGAISTIIAGVQWCLQERQSLGIRLLSLSLGGPGWVPYQIDPLCQALEKAWQAGLVVCVAAGNDGPAPFTISSPGIDPLLVTVGATDDKRTPAKGDDSVAPFSSRGPTLELARKPDLVAPGVGIVSLRAPGSTLDQAHPDFRVGDDYFRLSGTSMATPICAGAAALLLQSRPEATPDQVKRALLDGADDLFHQPEAAGAGYVDAAKALASLAPSLAAPPARTAGPAVVPGEAARRELLRLVEEAEHSLDLLLPAIGDLDLVEALAVALRRGLRLRLLLEPGRPANAESARFLGRRGGQVRSLPGLPEGVLAVADGRRLLLWNGRPSGGPVAGEGRAELAGVALRVDDPEAAAQASQLLEQAWETAGEAAFAAQAARGLPAAG